jgi:hypothetical protein
MTKIDEIFSAAISKNHGIVRRSKHDIDALIGFRRLLAAVKNRDFHLIETGDQYVIVCNPGVIQVHC